MNIYDSVLLPIVLLSVGEVNGTVGAVRRGTFGDAKVGEENNGILVLERRDEEDDK